MTRLSRDLARALQQGIELCRREKWHAGYDRLLRVAQQVERRGNLPGIFYSYLGVAMARCDGRRRDGMELCRYALQLEPYAAESYLNLASLYLILGRRRAAVRAVRRGLQLNPSHRRLGELMETLGVRQPCLFPALSRHHPFNSLSGRLRAWVGRRRRAGELRREEAALFGD